MGQMTWSSTEDSVDVSGIGPVDVEIDNAYDLQVAIGPTVDMGGWKLYGGLFYYSLDGDYEYEREFYELKLIDREEAHIQSDSDGGVFVGAVMDIVENSDLTAELSFTSDGWALGAGIAKKF